MAAISDESSRYNPLLAGIFDGPLIPHKVPEGIVLKGALNLSRVISDNSLKKQSGGPKTQKMNPRDNEGSPHCMLALFG